MSSVGSSVQRNCSVYAVPVLGAAAVFAAQSTVTDDCSVARCRVSDTQLSPLFVTRMIRYVSGTPW